MTARTYDNLRLLTRRRGRHRRPPEAARTIGRVTTTTLVTALLLLLIVIGYGTIDNRWYKVVAIEGRSMSPILNVGDLAFIGPPTAVEVGDLALVQLEDSVVAHRIVDIEPDGSYITSSDAGVPIERWRPNEIDLLGVYLFRLPTLGHLFGHGVGASSTSTEGDPVAASGS